MTSEERVFAVLNHKEPDMVPGDLCGTVVTGVNAAVYEKVLPMLGLAETPRIASMRSGIVTPSEAFLKKLGGDVFGIWPNSYAPDNWPVEQRSDARYDYVTDAFGIGWRKPVNGLYYDVYDPPIKGEELTDALIEGFTWPDLSADSLFVGMREKAAYCKEKGFAIFVENPMTEVLHLNTKLRGFETFLADLADTPEEACRLMDRCLDKVLEYYRKAFEVLEGHRLIIRTSDDLGGQNSLLISPSMYRRMVKPRHRRMVEELRRMARGEIKIFFHCDGAIRELIPDLIDVGFDALNPIQTNCPGMDLVSLKKEFGREITFWGGAIDAQRFILKANEREIEDEIHRNMDVLMPGGGFVFAPVHNVQPTVTPEKFLTIWNSFSKYRKYA